MAWKSSVEAAMSSMEAIQRVAAPALQVENPTAAAAPALQVLIPMVVATASSPNPSMGEEAFRLTWIWL
jgi:hypothetical protein